MPVQTIDLFCGVGGLTRGLLDAGLNVVAGFDIDPTCQFTYEFNNHVDYHLRNIREVMGEELNEIYDENVTKILVGCAPCQPFSQMRFKYGGANQNDEKYDLLLEFGRLIEEIHPTVISMENVPQIRETAVFNRFLPPTHNSLNIHVRDFIDDLPALAAGQVDEADPLHRSASLTEINLRRIRASVPGGTWKDWPEELRCKCHKKESGQTYGSVYGRMTWEQIGPTITTQFYSYGTGRYGHPEQDRALSLREGALLQTFPRNYNFIDPNRPFVFRDVARHIGNAVPVRLGEVIGLSIRAHLINNGVEV